MSLNSLNSLNSIKAISFEGMQDAIYNRNARIINTLSEDSQGCLINETITAQNEVEILNECLKNSKDQYIVIYGKNCCDEKIFDKYQQLLGLGFSNIHIYIGGLFEWLLLQELYGEEQFPTTSTQIEILDYK